MGEALEAAGAGYFLGGSLASSLQGDPRSTNDISLVTDLRPAHVAAFVDQLGADFDVDGHALEDCFQEGQSWSLFFLPEFTKIDLFPVGRRPCDAAEFGRRRLVSLESGAVWVKSPEDSVLRKLLWFDSGGRSSERQWRDVVQILRISGPLLDASYLDTWAPELGITDLLSRARAEAAAP